MVARCRKCGEKDVRYPLRDENGKWIISNFFKIDIYTLLWLIALALMIFGYSHDTSTCRDVLSDPVYYCNASNACEFVQMQEEGVDQDTNKNPFRLFNPLNQS